MIWSVIAVGVAGCASGNKDAAPVPESVTRVSISSIAGHGLGAEVHNDPGLGSRHIPAPIDSVWLTLPLVYELLAISEAGADVEQKMYGHPNFRTRRIEGKRLSAYIDCGMSVTAVPNADDYQVNMSVLTRLLPADDGGTVATTTVNGTGRPRNVSGNPVRCGSNGTLEARVADLILFVLIGGR